MWKRLVLQSHLGAYKLMRQCRFFCQAYLTAVLSYYGYSLVILLYIQFVYTFFL